MPNYGGNTKIAEYGARTRFGQSAGCDPKLARQLASDPWPVRRAVRRFAGAKFDSKLDLDAPMTLNRILRTIIPKGQERLVDVIAAGIWLAAWQGNLRAWDRLIEITDGPTPTVEEVNRQIASGEYL